jgi:hypothetical protein
MNTWVITYQTKDGDTNKDTFDANNAADAVKELIKRDPDFQRVIQCVEL